MGIVWALEHKASLSKVPNSDDLFLIFSSANHLYIAIVEETDERLSWLNLKDIVRVT